MHIELRECAPAAGGPPMRARDAADVPSDLTSTSCVPRLTTSPFFSHRRRSDPRRQRSMSPAREITITAEQFDALPPTLQKKYFSPLERLRIQQQHLLDERKKQMPKRSWLSPPSPVEASKRPATSQGLLRSSDANGPNHLKFPLLTGKQKNISDDQARWFLTLPEKIRRQHFSREEQITLMIRCKRILESTSPDLASDAYRRCCSDPKRRSRLSLISNPRPSTSAGVSFDGQHSCLDIDKASVRTTETSNAEMKIFKLYSRRTASNVTDYEKTTVDTAVESPPVSLPEAVQLPTVTPTPRKKPPFRRLSLTPLPLPPPTLAPPIPSLPPTQPVSRRPSLRRSSVSAALSARLSRPYMDMFSPGELPTIEPTSPSRPYHDIDIRKQLRRTLLSPEKFDEALEFGFENDETPAPMSPHTNFSFPFHDVPEVMTDEEDKDPLQSYIESEDETGYEEEDYDDHDVTSLDTTCPRTPTPIAGDLLPTSKGKTPSFDSAIGLPGVLNHIHAPRPPTSLADSLTSPREWTLHMTLTRADLAHPSPSSSSVSEVAAEAHFAVEKSAEEMLYSVQRHQTSGVGLERNDPLALERLKVCEDDTGAQGAFAVGRDGKASKGLKKVWKKFTGVVPV